MATWDGWQAYFLTVPGLSDTPATRAFLTEWAKHAEAPNCANNPIDLTHTISGESSNCKQTGMIGVNYQRYSLHVYARDAFALQINSGKYPNLKAALAETNPYYTFATQGVINDLNRWHSGAYAAVLTQELYAGSGDGIKAAHAHGGWADLQRSVNKAMPAAVANAKRKTRASLRTIARARKVRL